MSFFALQAGCFNAVEVSDNLKRAVLLQMFVGAKMETLMVASSGQAVLRVCAQFGNYVKLIVELPELKDPEPVLLPNVFTIMKASVTVTTLEGSSYLVVVIIITARPHTLDWHLWTGNKHNITSGLSATFQLSPHPLMQKKQESYRKTLPHDAEHTWTYIGSALSNHSTCPCISPRGSQAKVWRSFYNPSTDKLTINIVREKVCDTVNLTRKGRRAAL